jgi:hypothetical protein
MNGSFSEPFPQIRGLVQGCQVGTEAYLHYIPDAQLPDACKNLFRRRQRAELPTNEGAMIA